MCQDLAGLSDGSSRENHAARLSGASRFAFGRRPLDLAELAAGFRLSIAITKPSIHQVSCGVEWFEPAAIATGARKRSEVCGFRALTADSERRSAPINQRLTSRTTAPLV